MARFFAVLMEHSEPEAFEPLHFVASEDRVVVLGREQFRVKSSGLTWACEWAHAFERSKFTPAGGSLRVGMREDSAELRKTLTWDQGAEMAQHVALRQETGMAVYFCEPRSPWQRGSNENLNGLLRQYFPKGTESVSIWRTGLERGGPGDQQSTSKDARLANCG